MQAFLKAADAQSKNGTPFSAARSLEEAAGQARALKRPDVAAKYLRQAAVYYQEKGSDAKAAETLKRAGEYVDAAFLFLFFSLCPPPTLRRLMDRLVML